MKTRHIPLLLGLALLGLQCQSPSAEGGRSGAGFRPVPARTSHIEFTNSIVEDEEDNVLNYEYFYNGGGVAVGDLNQDGRPDLYFTANMGPNSLYLNEGDWSFRDATTVAGVAGRENGWNTGVTMASANWCYRRAPSVGKVVGRGRHPARSISTSTVLASTPRPAAVST